MIGKQLKFLLPVFFVMAVLLVVNAYFGSREQTQAELLAIAQSDPGIDMEDLVLTDEEAEELGLTPTQALNACVVFNAQAEAGIFSEDTFVVAYLTDGGEPVPESIIVPAGTVLTKPEDPVKPGYTFLYWEYKLPCDSKSYKWDFDNDIVGFNVVLVAMYEEVASDTFYDVNFNTDGGRPVPNSQSVKEGDKVKEPEAPVKDGYIFDGWFNGNDEWDFDTDVVTGGLNLVAKWTEDNGGGNDEEHEVTFDTDGGTPVPPPQKIKDGDKITKPQDPSKPGYNFDGWFDGEDEWDFDNNVVNDELDLVAKWEIDPNYIFIVTFDADGGSPVPADQKIGTEQKVTEPNPAPTKAGYNFDGWYLGNEEWDFDTDVVTSDITLVAKWNIDSREEHEVIFDTFGGTPVPPTQYIKAGNKAIKPQNPTKPGYIFSGWYDGGWFNGEEEWDFDNDVVSNDLELTARWEIDTNYRFTVIFDTDGGSPVPAEQKVGTEQRANKPYPDPIKPGYIFEGWYFVNNRNLWDFDLSAVIRDMTLTAKWSKDPNYREFYAVRFDSNGGAPTPVNQIVANGGKVAKPADPTRAGYRFIGWAYNSKLWDFSTDTVTADITLNGRWEADPNYKDEYTVNFDANGGTPTPPTQTVKNGNKAVEPADPTKPGYIFDGWYQGNTIWDFDDIVNKDLNLVAKWVVDPNYEYTVTFDADGGAPTPPSQKVKTGGKVVEPAAPSKTGYIFVGWFLNNTSWAFNNDTVTSDITLKARWIVDPNYKDEYQVTFNANGGTPTPPSQSVKHGEKAVKPADPVNPGYLLDGWFLNGVEWNFDTPVTRDLNLIANWVTDPNYKEEFTVTFDPDGGTPTPPAQKVLDGSRATKPADPTKEGFIFTGWYLGGQVWNFAANVVTSNITLVAKWDVDITKQMFDVTFNADGGTPQPNAQRVMYGSKLVKPADPSKTGYTFAYWYYVNASNQEVVWDFNVSQVYSNLELTAKYTVNPTEYTVEFNADGGAPTPNAQKVVEGGKVARPLTDPVKPGYIFVEWSYNNRGWDFANNTVDSNRVLVATYRLDPTQQNYTVTFDSMGGSAVPTQTVRYGNLATKPANPTMGGYDFLYWYALDNGIEAEWDFATDRVTGDITLYAKYKESAKEYVVRFNANGGAPTPENQIVEEGQKVTRPIVNPSRLGYTFEYWYLAGNEATAWDFNNNTVSSDMELVAKFKDNREGQVYCVSFYTDGGTPTPQDQNVVFGGKVVKPTDPSRAGYIFSHWVYFDAQGRETTWNFDVDTVQGNTQLIARYTVDPVKHYSVYFFANGGTPTPEYQRVREGGLVTKPVDPQKTGYDFIGWLIINNGTGGYWDFNSPVTGDLVLMAQYQAKQTGPFTVEFEPDGGSPKPPTQTVMGGGKVTKPADPAKPGYIFKGWYYLDSSGNTVLWNFETDVVTRNMSLFAQYGAEPVKDVKVTFNANGGTPTPDPQTVKQGSKIVEPMPPIKVGYILKGWYYTSGSREIKWDFMNDVVNNDMVLNAKYECATSLKVKFNSNGGTTTPTTQTVRYGGYATKPTNPSRTNFTFEGWYYTDPTTGAEKLWDFGSDRVFVDMTLVAKWKVMDKDVKITWYDSLRCKYTYTYVKAGDTIDRIADPSGNKCYRFFRWTVSCAEWDFSKPVYTDMKLNAEYHTKDCCWFMKHDSNGGTFVPQSLANVNSTYDLTRVKTPTWAGTGTKTFAGWEYNGKIVTSIRATSDMTFKATWK
jgi:uncharacterized repeat protein (TIGR02543 family)